MSRTTTCRRCGGAYAESSEDRANVPAWAATGADRLCPECWAFDQEAQARHRSAREGRRREDHDVSDTLMRIELDRLAKLWPAMAAGLGSHVRARDADERIAKLQERRDELERELEDVEDELGALLNATARSDAPPSRSSTWQQVDEQIAIVETLAAQYRVRLPEHIAEAFEARRLAKAPLVSVVVGRPERLDHGRTTR